MFKSKTLSIIVSIFILISLPVGIFLVQQQTHFLNEAFGVPANIYVDAANPIQAPQGVWKYLAQGGEEKGRALSSVIPQVRDLHPQLIRLDHIYDLYNVVSKDGAGNLNFNWGDLDQMVLDIKAIGSTPLLSLSYMPPAISSDGGTTSLPGNWGDWELTVQKTIEHYSGKGGMNLSGIYYEVWNEPNLFGNFKIGGSKSYMDLYSHAAAGAGRVSGVNGFKFGGPAISDLYQNWFDALMQSGMRVDFFSWHKYSKDIGDYEKQASDIKKWLSAYPNRANTELLITEIGIDSENNSAYDGRLAAIQTMATSAILEGNINKSFAFEIKDGPGPTQFWGRWGLFTNDKFGAPQPKPRYSALLFLNQMRGTKLASVGNGSWVKAFAEKDGNTVRIFAVNYDPYGNHAESVPIRVDHLTNQNYLVRRIDFQGGTRNRNTTVTGNVIDITESFRPNSAAIFEIIPQ